MANKNREFWNKEYKKPEHLALSTEPAEDFLKFIRWLERTYGEGGILDKGSSILDLGCGNGRNLIFLCKAAGCSGVGYDISSEAIKQAKLASGNLPITFEARTIEGPLDVPNESVTLALDMMTSHFLDEKGRAELLKEILRVLEPRGWLFFKSFLADEDLHAKRLLRTNPSGEKDTYIHPRIGVSEHVWTERSFYEFFEPHFKIHQIEKSFRHILHGKAFKRRTLCAYLEKR